MPIEIAATVVGALLAAIGGGIWYCVKACNRLGSRLTMVEVLLKMHLRKNGTTDEEIEAELATNSKGGCKL